MSRAPCFEPSDTALFERGFPALHVLTETKVTPAAARALAKTAIDAIDPRLPVFVPSDVARRFVHGYLVGRTFGNDKRVNIVMLPDRVREQEEALASNRALDLALFETFLDKHCPVATQWKTQVSDQEVAVQETETYGWRLAEIVYVFEAAFGTEKVARILAERLLRAHHDVDSWTFWARDPYRHNASGHHLALAFGTMRRRMGEDLWRELVAPFRDLASDKLLVFSDLLACLADDARTSVSPYYAIDLAIQRSDPEALAKASIGEGVFYRSQVPWLLGESAFASTKLGAVRKLPDWLQVRFVDEVGRLALPKVALFIATLVSCRAGRRAASDWLNEHADFARPIVAAEAERGADASDRKRLEAALAVLDGAKVPAAKALGEAGLAREMKHVFGTLEKKLTACKGKVDKEREVIRGAFEHYCEARAAAGIVLPSAHFGHELIDWRAKDATAQERWMGLVAEVMAE